MACLAVADECEAEVRMYLTPSASASGRRGGSTELEGVREVLEKDFPGTRGAGSSASRKTPWDARRDVKESPSGLKAERRVPQSEGGSRGAAGCEAGARACASGTAPLQRRGILGKCTR